MKKIALFALFAAASSFALACNGDNSNNDGGTDSGPADTGGGDVATDAGNPTPPALKTQVDRMGRPAVNTALNHAFDPGPTAGMAKDAYNADSTMANWAMNYVPQFSANLAILDALDTKTVVGDGCGNQLAYSQTSHYKPLATVIADDQLYVDTSKTTCTAYLAVELQATGLMPNTDCGGRGLAYDVINITYGAASGNGNGLTVTDGPTTAVPSKTNGTTFPYLAAPM